MARNFTAANTEYFQVDVPVVTAYPATISLWMVTPAHSSVGLFCLGDTASASNYISLELVAGFVRGYVTTGNSITLSAAGQVAINTWHHICYVLASSTDRSLYLNYTSSTSVATSVNWPAGHDNTAIGRYSDQTPNLYYTGDIAEVAVWNAALGTGHIYMLAKGVPAPLVQRANLVSYWPMFGDTSDAIPDLIGGNNMAAFNTPPKATTRPRIIYPQTKKIILPSSGGSPSFSVPTAFYHFQQQWMS